MSVRSDLLVAICLWRGSIVPDSISSSITHNWSRRPNRREQREKSSEHIHSRRTRTHRKVVPSSTSHILLARSAHGALPSFDSCADLCCVARIACVSRSSPSNVAPIHPCSQISCENRPLSMAFCLRGADKPVPADDVVAPVEFRVAVHSGVRGGRIGWMLMAL